MAKETDKDGRRVVARNKKARYKYFIEERVEAGLVLRGTEVKSLRAGHVALGDSFGRFRKSGELYLLNCHIAQYDKAAYGNHEPMRPRKLLLHKRQLKKLRTKVEERGYSLVPLTLYFIRGLAKVDLGIARGKQTRDRRQDLRKRDAEREIRRATR